MRAKMMISPIRKKTIDQISRPAGRIQGNQSGIKLGIGPVVLREAYDVGESAERFPITLSEGGAHRGVVPINSINGCTTGSARDDARVRIRPRSQAHKHG
jgi:hypothetical protein